MGGRALGADDPGAPAWVSSLTIVARSDRPGDRHRRPTDRPRRDRPLPARLALAPTAPRRVRAPVRGRARPEPSPGLASDRRPDRGGAVEGIGPRAGAL